jgi:hypothetical protein
MMKLRGMVSLVVVTCEASLVARLSAVSVESTPSMPRWLQYLVGCK